VSEAGSDTPILRGRQHTQNAAARLARSAAARSPARAIVKRRGSPRAHDLSDSLCRRRAFIGLPISLRCFLWRPRRVCLSRFAGRVRRTRSIIHHARWFAATAYRNRTLHHGLAKHALVSPRRTHSPRADHYHRCRTLPWSRRLSSAGPRAGNPARWAIWKRRAPPHSTTAVSSVTPWRHASTPPDRTPMPALVRRRERREHGPVVEQQTASAGPSTNTVANGGSPTRALFRGQARREPSASMPEPYSAWYSRLEASLSTNAGVAACAMSPRNT